VEETEYSGDHHEETHGRNNHKPVTSEVLGSDWCGLELGQQFHPLTGSVGFSGSFDRGSQGLRRFLPVVVHLRGLGVVSLSLSDPISKLSGF